MAQKVSRKKQRKVRPVKSREDFIDHIQRVEAYLKGSDLNEVDQHQLPPHLQSPEVAADAAALWDAFAANKQTPVEQKDKAPEHRK